MKTIAFTKVALPFGWLGNMSPHSIEFGGKTYRTAEALFQSLRFGLADGLNSDVTEEIRAEKSPIGAKMVAKKYADKMRVIPASPDDLALMEQVVRLKLAQHPSLLGELVATEDALIIEDVSNRGTAGRHRFWGAALVGEEWIGENALGKLWMRIRSERIPDEKNCKGS
jgi:predicted NAD-dependent protein-ADP-ribosyltransferase YbiA (DUF1768 family)